MADSIKCPEYRAEIPLTEVISHQIEEELAAKLARELAAREQQFEAREKALAEATVAREKALVDEAAEREARIRQEYEEAGAVREAELQKACRGESGDRARRPRLARQGAGRAAA
jgi:hypothetical protein